MLAKTQRFVHITRNPEVNQPGGLVPATAALDRAVSARPTCPHLNEEFKLSVRDVGMERPYWQPSGAHTKNGSNSLLKKRANVGNIKKVVRKMKPIHWDVVVERFGDLVVDREDLIATRKIMLNNMPMIVTTFSYYAKLGPATTSETSSDFMTIRPAMAPGLSKMGELAAGATARLFGKRLVAKPETSEFLVERPSAAASLGQFRQLCLDCEIIGSGMRMSDVGRLFALSNRFYSTPPPHPSDLDEGSTSDEDENDRQQDLSLQPALTNEPEACMHVHNLRQRCSIYGFVECLLRVAATKFAVGGETPCKTLAEQFTKLCTDCLLPYGCSHENVTDSRWATIRPSTHTVHRAYRAQLERVFNFFSGADDEIEAMNAAGKNSSTRAQEGGRARNTSVNGIRETKTTIRRRRRVRSAYYSACLFSSTHSAIFDWTGIHRGNG
eukprot:COSAG05_NODE_529_length_8913_cov_14.963921_5_plen_440_part_00